MDQIILDFENSTIEFDSDHQKGIEVCPDLQVRKEDILQAMGYSNVDLSDFIANANDLINGEMTREDFQRYADSEAQKEP